LSAALVAGRGISANGIITGGMWVSGIGQHGFIAVCQ
jgi:hypothetical protein